MKLKLEHSVHRESDRIWREGLFGPPPVKCEVCERSLDDRTTAFRRVRFGAYIGEHGNTYEDVCKTCYDCGYGSLYEMQCHDCGSVQTHNRRCDGPYSAWLDCDTCKVKSSCSFKYTRHTRGRHAGDVSKDRRPP